MTFDDLFEEEDEAGLANLLSDLFPGQEALLFHLLVCCPCRDRAATGLLARYGTSLVLPVGGLAELLGDDCDPDFPIDGWVDELLAHPREHHFDLLDEPRFGDGLLVQPLLERCQREQLREPELAEHLALLAVRLADTVRIRHLSEARLPEAALASLDLALVLADLGRIPEIEPLAVELVERFPGEAAAAAAKRLRDIPWTEPDGLRRKVEAASQALRRSFRLAGPRPRPLPFA